MRAWMGNVVVWEMKLIRELAPQSPKSWRLVEASSTGVTTAWRRDLELWSSVVVITVSCTALAETRLSPSGPARLPLWQLRQQPEECFRFSLPNSWLAWLSFLSHHQAHRIRRRRTSSRLPALYFCIASTDAYHGLITAAVSSTTSAFICMCHDFTRICMGHCDSRGQRAVPYYASQSSTQVDLRSPWP